MAKKKHARPKAPPVQWLALDVVELLAWLDHTLKYRDLDFENTIASHLRQIYSISQINRKLISLWTIHGPEQPPGLPRSTWRGDLFSLGSACLNGTNGLNDDILKEISNRTKALEKQRSAEIPPVTRRLRSSSRQIDVSNARQNCIDSPARSAYTPQGKRFRLPSTSLTPSAIKQETEQTKPPIETKSSSKKRRRRQLERSPTTGSVITIEKSRRQSKRYQESNASLPHPPLVDDSDDDLSELCSEDFKSEEQQDEIRCICGATENDSKVPWVECSACKVWQHIFCVKGSFDDDDYTFPDDYFCEKCDPKAHEVHRDRMVSFHTVEETLSELVEHTPDGVLAELPFPTEASALTPPSLPAFEDLPCSTDTRLQNARGRIQELEEEVLELKREISYNEGFLSTLDKQVLSLRAAQKRRDADSGFPVEELTERHLNAEKRYLAALRIREEGTKFTTLVGTSREWFGNTKLDDGFDDIYGQTRQVWCRRNNDTVPFIPSLIKHPALRDLVSRCLGPLPEDLTADQEAMCKLSKFSPEAIVRALITSALAESVFETDFPQFDNSSSEVLSKYRELLITQDGAVTLRNLDLAARNSLTKSTAFRQQIIPQNAKILAIKLSQTLAPLFSNTSEQISESDWDGFATWRDDQDEWMDRRKRFIQMFTFALQTKADSCLNIQDYEMLIYPPGTKFDKKTMEVETRNCVKDTTRHEGRTVELCLEAAVFAHGRKALSEDSTIAEAVMSSKNFVHKDRKDRYEIKPTVKAVVILSDP